MRDQFCASGGDLCYYPLLFKALEATEGDVLEFGMGHGSTPLLNKYCNLNKRSLFSFDYNEEWRVKFNDILGEYHTSELVKDWKEVYKNYTDAPVIFIDQSPGEERKETIKNYANTTGILVIHDTEPTGAGDYQMRQHFGMFKYKVEVKTAGAWATALSNEIDITKWNGELFGGYTIDAN